MFGISFSEMILIGVIALIVFGPGEIPQIVANLSKFIQNLKVLWQNTKNDLYQQSGLSEIQASLDIKKIYGQIVDEISAINSPTIGKDKSAHNDVTMSETPTPDKTTKLDLEPKN